MMIKGISIGSVVLAQLMVVTNRHRNTLGVIGVGSPEGGRGRG